MVLVDKIRSYFEGIKTIEAIKAQYYAKGQEDAATRFIVQQKKMTAKIEELTEQNIAIEKRLRTTADNRIERMENLHETRCTSCMVNMEAERQRLIKRQNQLAKKMADFEEVWVNMYQHANTIIDEHDILLRSSGRLVASRNILIGFKKKVDDIMEKSAPLLSVELSDGSKDKIVDLSDTKALETDSLSSKDTQEENNQKNNK